MHYKTHMQNYHLEQAQAEVKDRTGFVSKQEP